MGLEHYATQHRLVSIRMEYELISKKLETTEDKETREVLYSWECTCLQQFLAALQEWCETMDALSGACG
jgi:hypothetical protein